METSIFFNFDTKNFNIKKVNWKKKEKIDISREVILDFDEHFDEIQQRFLHISIIMGMLILLTFLNITWIVEILELPVKDLRFFQSSPGDFFISTVQTALYLGFVLSVPLFLNQLIYFFFPGLNASEQKVITYLILGSIILFILSFIFSYFVLIPTALMFFLNYNKNLIEPLLSFNQYLVFVAILFFTTGLLFQIPIIQILLKLFNIISSETMLNLWRPILLGSTIISAIFTPSADPVTQLLLSSVLVVLYLLGAWISRHVMAFS